MQGDAHGCSKTMAAMTIQCASIENTLADCKGQLGNTCNEGFGIAGK